MHKQTKTTQKQIQSHLKKVDVSRFPVVLNEAIIRPGPENSEWTNVFRSWCQSRHFENILKQMAPQ